MLSLAYVRNTDDPEGIARVAVEYLGHAAGSLSDWAPVSTVMAGHESGVFTMPEEGDLVVVGFLNGDRNAPVVLGSIWNGSQHPPNDAITERCFVSRNGHSLTLSDGNDDGILLEDSHANRIVMNAKGITIETEGTLTIKVAGDTLFETSGEATHIASTLKLNP